MAVITPVEQPNLGRGQAKIFAWIGLTPDDDAEPVSVAGFADNSVQIAGVFGVSGEWHLRGSDDAQIFNTLNDLTGNPLEFTAADLRSVRERVAWIKPVRAAGVDGAMNVDVFVILN